MVRRQETRKILSIIAVLVLGSSIFSLSVSPAKGWGGSVENHHGNMTLDALMNYADEYGIAHGLWTAKEIRNIAYHANDLDWKEPSGKFPPARALLPMYCHSVKIYQTVFQNPPYSKTEQHAPPWGAEDWASHHVGKAREAYMTDNKEEAMKELGYGIHYIQDALCPPHVFPFQQGPLTDSANFEAYAAVWYAILPSDSGWKLLVRNGRPAPISSPAHLRDEIVKAAGWVHNSLTCYFKALDGVAYKAEKPLKEGVYSTANIPTKLPCIGCPPRIGWYMADDDIASIMVKIAGLVKGAAIWAKLSMQISMQTIWMPISYFTTTSTTIYSTTTSRRCLVATAIYDSELSPEVQFLRDFRDNMVLSSFAGGSFMQAFNAWYYSFSPSVAEFISEHSTAKAVLRAALYPLLRILHLSSEAYSAFGSNSEMAVIVTGLIASSLIGVAYLLPIMILLTFSARKRAGSKMPDEARCFQ